MIDTDAKRLQSRLGVVVDGDLGPGSFKALFRRLGASEDIASELGIAAAVHLPRFGISESPLRLAHFIAQVGHESGGFHYMEEIASGAAYEGRDDLGNTQPGDGRRYKGRGPIQLTGRANYRKFGRKLGLDLERHPEMASYPSVGLLAGCLYWSEHGLNALADANDVEAITRKINGGLNGFQDRQQRLVVAKGLML